MRQLPLAIGIAPEPRFDNFVAGANGQALAHLRALGDAPGAPLYLWGPAGSGKTHLLRALASASQEAGRRVGWFDAGTALPWPLLPEWSLLVIDRCEALSAPAQHAAFALFIEAATHGVQVAAAGRLPPVDLPLRDDLRTRLGWGHVFALQPLSDADTRAALRREAQRRGALLTDELIDHLLLHHERDLGSLMPLFDRLDRFALAQGRRITLPLLRLMLQEERLEAAR